MKSHIPLDQDRIADFCRRHRIERLAFLGSVLRDDFRPESDVDVLVTFARDASCSLFEMVHLEEELGAILGRKVDLIEREAVEQSENYIRRRSILESEEPVYVAG
jgi:predicted nucleotidyltransferase